MQFSYTLTLTFIFTLTSTILANIENLATSTGPESEAPNVVQATWEEPAGSISPDPNPTNHVNAQKRKVAGNPYTVPYPLQTGPTRYAPVAKKAGTAVAKTSPTPQFPASPYVIATEYMKPGTVETTLTASETLSVTMMENTAAPAPHP
ncbi:hypothetical protein BDW62DRAFT_92623 [Aspergillus aurantiobrunneus]